MLILKLTPEIFVIFGVGILLLGIAVGMYFKIPTSPKRKKPEEIPPTMYRKY